MLTHPQFDPVAIQLGPLAVHWYGLMYLLGFAGAWALGRYRTTRPGSTWQAQEVGDLLYFCALGVVLGGRLGYVLFYQPAHHLAHPLDIFKVWQGGMAFHGGLIGVLLAAAWFGRKTGRSFFQVTDFIAPLVPLGLLFGRIGNFINGELWGKPTGVPWGMVFPQVGDGVARHPSQLYEAGLEGFALFLLLWLYSARPRPTMAVSGLFLLGYGAARFTVEFFRQPDAFLGYLAFGWLTMGQLLCVPMLVAGAGLLALAYRHR